MDCFVYPIQGYHTLTTALNPIRLWQFIFCCICLGFAIFFNITMTGLSKILVFAVVFAAVAFSFLTLLDIISMWYLRPIFWNSWIVIATLASLLFWLGAGILLIYAIKMVDGPSIAATIFYILTGIIFLIDVIFILWWLLSKQYIEVGPEMIQVGQIENEAPLTCQSLRTEPRMVEETFMDPVPCYCEPEEPPSSRNNYTRVRRCVYYAGDSEAAVPSYGGTFPVDRDATPLFPATPAIPKELHTRSQQHPERGGSTQSQARTVAVSTRSVPRTRPQSHQEPSLKNVGKSSPATSLDDCRRSVRSAETSTAPSDMLEGSKFQYPVQQQPEVVYHQYLQNPCGKCGRTRYQTAPTLHGSFDGFASQPSFVACKSCQNQNCGCKGPKVATSPTCSPLSSPRHNGLDEIKEVTRKETVILSQLEPIQEATTPRLGRAKSGVEQRRASSPRGYCTSVRYSSTPSRRSSSRMDAIRSETLVVTDDEEVQTSETRIIKAKDVQKIQLPGAADRSPPCCEDRCRDRR